MHATLPLLNALSFPAITRGQLQALQVNLTYLCNQRCLHCHVNAGPTRTEAMTDESLAGNPIVTRDHCYACAAGQGSSCGGALDNQ